jgi:regulatory protein
MKKPVGGLSLKGRALQMLAQREHSQMELRRKLLRHARAEVAAEAGAASASPDADPGEVAQGEAAARVDDLLQWLLSHRYLSDVRFVESRVHVRAPRFGNLRIRQELAQHGLALGEAVGQHLRDSEQSRAQAVWQRKYGQAPADAAERARQMRFLAQRGFSADVIRQVLKSAGRITASPESPSDGDDDLPDEPSS